MSTPRAMPCRLPACAAAALAWAALSPLGAALPFNAIATLEVEYDSNLGRFASSEDAVDALAVHGKFAGEHTWALGRDWHLTAAGAAGASHVLRYDDFDRVTVDARLALRRRFGLGLNAPALRLESTVGREEARRDGADAWTSSTALVFLHRPSESWRYRAGVAVDHGEAEDDFFGRHSRSAFADVQWTAASGLALTAEARIREGTILAHARPPAAWRQPGTYLATVALRPVQTFGFRANAYALEAQTLDLGLTANFALAPRTTAQVRLGWSRTERDALDYRNVLARAAVQWQF